MNCFIHRDVEAASICKKCGKPMCSSCSKHDIQKQICPECLKLNLENELKQKQRKQNELIHEQEDIYNRCRIYKIASIICGILGALYLVALILSENEFFFTYAFALGLLIVSLSSFLTSLIEKPKADKLTFKINNLTKTIKSLSSQIENLQALLNIIVTNSYR